MPVGRVLPDGVFPDGGELLGHVRDLFLTVPGFRHENLIVNVRAPLRFAFEKGPHRHERRARLHGQRRRAGAYFRRLAEERNFNTIFREVAVGDQADQLSRP
jgi:hypothetical protein